MTKDLARHQEIFNQIMHYYDYAQKLVLAIDNKKVAEEFLNEVGQLIEMLELGADSLTSSLIDLVQNNSELDFEENCQRILDQIIIQISHLEKQIEDSPSA